MWNGKKLEQSKYGVSAFFNVSFQCLSEPNDLGAEWYNFGCIENIPDCIKYNYPHSDIEFRLPPASQDKVQLMIDIWDVIGILDYERRFHLNPVRWDRIKSNLSEGWCYCPWVTYNEKTNKPEFMDGRHRMMALLKFTKYRKIPFIVEAEYKHLLEAFFNHSYLTSKKQKTFD